MKKSFAALVTLLSVSTVYAAGMPKGDAAAGQALSAQCAACHGADGNSAAPTFPSLAGQNAKYIYKQLHDFKSGRRNNALMMPMVADKTDQQMADLAVYFSQQKGGVQLADPALINKGERLYRGGNAATGLAACAGPFHKSYSNLLFIDLMLISCFIELVSQLMLPSNARAKLSTSGHR
jgi:cytochrome c553